jgi:hypothetical protein
MRHSDPLTKNDYGLLLIWIIIMVIILAAVCFGSDTVTAEISAFWHMCGPDAKLIFLGLICVAIARP